MMDWKKYLIFFAQEHVDFRFAELESLLKLWSIPHKFPTNVEEEILKPFLQIDLPNDEYAKKLTARSVSIRCILELWSIATTFDCFHQQLRNLITENANNAKFNQLFVEEKTFRVTVESYMKKFSQKDKVDRIESLTYLPIKGNVNLKNPDVEWYYIEYYGLDTLNVPESPYNIIFGKWIADGNRNMIKDISLKTRKFIGNTSMDPTLSVLMANQAMVSNGDLVLDPFVGSGSLLVPAAKFGGFVIGTDIDYLMLHGRTKPTRVSQKKVRDEDESILSNLKQYNCSGQYIDVMVSDFSNSIWHSNMQFDCIITDPPYGIREATEKIETKERRPAKPENGDVPHYPSTSHYSLSNLYGDLLLFSAKHLRMGGRLVCWIPIFKSTYTEKMLPASSCFKLIANSEQLISNLTSRRLLTYEKIAEPNEESMKEFEHSMADFRKQFFDSNVQTRQERRMQKAELREIGRQEAIKRGTVPADRSKEYKVNENKKRFK